MDGINDNSNTLFMSPQQDGLDAFNLDETPYLDDYLDRDNSFDFDNADLDGDMMGDLPADGDGEMIGDLSGDGDGDLMGDRPDDGNSESYREKRKNPNDENEDEGDHKRQEKDGDERGAKKPGRKPLTSEPTTKRKAQNRAAQRAFRERKEKHLKDLETKVTELSKAQEADKHENGILKAQVEKLETEVKEYRKRWSTSNTVRTSNQRSSSGPSPTNNFEFDFPKFGALPGSQLFGNSMADGNDAKRQPNTCPPPITRSATTNGSFPPITRSSTSNGSFPPAAQLIREGSAGRSVSPKHNSAAQSPPSFGYGTRANTQGNGFSSTLPQMSTPGAADAFGDLFSPSILKTLSHNGSLDGNYFGSPQPMQTGAATVNGICDSGTDSTSGLNRVFHFNSGSSASDTASPSTSSLSQWNANSSCGTSPEPSHGSPANKDKCAESFPKTANYTTPAPATHIPSAAMLNNDAFAFPSLDAFDPVLFADYRDSQDALTGGGADFTGGFFDEALNPSHFNLASPSNLFGILHSPAQQPLAPVPASRSLMAEVEKQRDGADDGDYALPTNSQPHSPLKNADGSAKLISCNNIWNQLQSNPDFQHGTFDLDGLCAELRIKARCSESGVLVDQLEVDAALRKLGARSKEPEHVPPEMPTLMFEQDSWENVLNKLGGGEGVRG